MQEQITLSNTEKKHYFFYLLGMLVFAVVLLVIIFLYQKNSPFSNAGKELTNKENLLIKAGFEKKMVEIMPTIDSAYANIKKIDTDKSEEISLTDETSMKVQTINDFSVHNQSTDPRAKIYKHIIYFDQMFIDDKNHVIRNKKKIAAFEENIQECMNRNNFLKK